MLTDVIKITNTILKEFIPNNIEINSSKNLYDIYRLLERVVSSTHLVYSHYLALDFSEEYLQNSSFGQPSNKWRHYLNEDLEALNKDVKAYLLKLQHLSSKDNRDYFESYMSSLFYPKMFYSYINSIYSVGYIAPNSFEITSDVLTKKFHPEQINLRKSFKVNLATYEERLLLQKHLEDKKVKLDNLLSQLKEYILCNYTLNDLL